MKNLDLPRFLVTEEYSDAKVIMLVTDNLNIHKEKSFYETFSEEEAKTILEKIGLEKIRFHYTKNASWLNAEEIEINVMDIECIGRRIGDMEGFTHEMGAWMKRRNDHQKKIEWKFTRKNADEKMSKYYVK